ncbi:MAG: glycosyltransferase [Candidatus Bathyarchaeota archaeon]|nr:glycosyltransferase [Candidatus Bathyarchaeota archaeon]
MANILWIPHKGTNRPIEGKRWKAGVKWCADFMLENIQKNINNKYKVIVGYDFNKIETKEIDAVWLENIATTAFNNRIIFKTSKISDYIKKKPRPIYLGGVQGFIGFERCKKYLKYFDAIHVGSNELLNAVLPYNKRAYLCEPGIDTSIFKPMEGEKEFCLGWAGDSEKEVKNTELLPSLGFPVKMATKANYIPNEEMPKFYASISVYVNISSSEGFCRPLVEAASCGKPVISTNVGIASKLLESEWVIEGDPRNEKTQKTFKDKIIVLNNDPELRRRIGERNRISALRWSWSNTIKQVETIFEEFNLK